MSGIKPNLQPRSTSRQEVVGSAANGSRGMAAPLATSTSPRARQARTAAVHPAGRNHSLPANEQVVEEVVYGQSQHIQTEAGNTADEADVDALDPEREAASGAQSRARVVLVLCGGVGAGKSTFACNLEQFCPKGRWARVNQDTVNKGKPGKRKQCVTAAQKALLSGRSPIIDRCNFNKDQRSDFLQLAREQGVECHCVHLALPTGVVVARAVQRKGHEAGVEGESAAKVASRMSSMLQKDPPTKAEGFATVLVVKSNRAMAAAYAAWSTFDAAATQHPSSFQPLPLFLSSLRNATWDQRSANFRLDATPVKQQGSGLPVASRQLPSPAPTISSQPSTSTAPSPARGATRQASITAFFKPQTQRSATVAAAVKPGPHAVGESIENLVPIGGASVPATNWAPPEKPPVGARKRETPASAAGPAGPDDPPAKVLKLQDEPAHGPRPASGGHGQVATGQLPPKQHFSFRTFPQMNRFQRLVRDPEAVAKSGYAAFAPSQLLHVLPTLLVLRDSFPKAAHHYLVIARDPELVTVYDLEPRHVGLLREMLKVARQLAAHLLRQGALGAAGGGSADFTMSMNSVGGQGYGAAFAGGNDVSKEGPGGDDVSGRGAGGDDISREVARRFQFGFHGIPSVPQLHMHVISRDFVAPTLRKPKHWKSFTTAVFVPADRVIRDLEGGGRVGVRIQECMAAANGPLLCPLCGVQSGSLPQMKAHYSDCYKRFLAKGQS